MNREVIVNLYTDMGNLEFLGKIDVLSEDHDSYIRISGDAFDSPLTVHGFTVMNMDKKTISKKHFNIKGVQVIPGKPFLLTNERIEYENEKN